MPQITVIVPVYKVEPYLRRCVDSILSQTFTDFDLVLIDDGSPDRCGEICDEYANSDERVTVIHHEKNLGLSAARNSGIDWAFKESDSQWLNFIDSDDWVARNYLEALLYAAQGHSLSVAKRKKTNGETYPVPSDLSFTMWNTEELWCNQYADGVVVWGKLYKKELFSSIRFPVQKIYEDTYTTHKILFQFDQIPVTNESFCYYFFNPDSIVHQKWSVAKLDQVYATAEQIDYFINNGFVSIAKVRFDHFRKISTSSIQKIESSAKLTEAEKKKNISKIRKSQRKVLVKCRRYRWCSVWNRGKDLWFISNAFTSIHVAHMIWRSLKIICSTIKNRI